MLIYDRSEYYRLNRAKKSNTEFDIKRKFGVLIEGEHIWEEPGLYIILFRAFIGLYQ